MIECDALLALVRAENHRSRDDARLASLRQLGIATNSLAVLDDYLSNSSENWYSSQAFPPPYSLLGRDEGPPSDEELAPLGGESTGFELITQVYEPADEVRRMEVAFALAKNLRNTRISKIHVLAENGRDGRFASTVAALVGATHVHVQILGRRLRFSDAEGYAALHWAQLRDGWAALRRVRAARTRSRRLRARPVRRTGTRTRRLRVPPSQWAWRWRWKGSPRLAACASPPRPRELV